MGDIASDWSSHNAVRMRIAPKCDPVFETMTGRLEKLAELELLEVSVQDLPYDHPKGGFPNQAHLLRIIQYAQKVTSRMTGSIAGQILTRVRPR
jgi:hypothetical protein